jgi:hypothetical protein
MPATVKTRENLDWSGHALRGCVPAVSRLLQRERTNVTVLRSFPLPDELRQDQKCAGKTLMDEGQRGRNIGSGMKLLWNKRVKIKKRRKSWQRSPLMRDRRTPL